MADRRPMRLARWRLTALIVGLLGVTGCRHAASTTSPWQTTAVDDAPPGLVLMQAPAGGAGVITTLYDALANIEGRKPAARMLLDVANSWDDATLATSQGARRVAIKAVYATAEAGAIGERFAEIQTLVDRMVKHAKDTAETHFALAYLRWILISDGAGGVSRRGLDDDVLRDLLGHLDALVRTYPTFDGPGDFDRRRIRRERASVRALLAAKTPEPTGAP